MDAWLILLYFLWAVCAIGRLEKDTEGVERSVAM